MKVIHFKTINSTNIYAKEMLTKANSVQDLNETVIYADEQTAGHGRMNRSFYSPNQTGIYMSLIYSPAPEKAITNPALITASTAVAVCRILDAEFSISSQIKWVNDIYLNDKKICGILTEGHIDLAAGSISAAVIGIGINLFTQSFPEEIQNKAGSVCEQNNTATFNKENLIKQIAKECIKIYDSPQLLKETFSEYRKRSFLSGKLVTVKPVIDNTEKDYQATVISITDDAKLHVRLEDGTEKILDSGEISLKVN